jgi:methylglutaconyl-CoA hydratase
VTTELVHLETAGGVATITMDSPENRNALSRRLMSDLHGHLQAALADSRARVLVITGSGPVFCAGADLKEQRAANEAGEGSTLNAASMPAMLNAIWESPKPVVARVNGHARAGGIGIIGACDLAVAVDHATFAFSEVRIGVAPAIISVVTVPKIGITKAMELFLTGNTFDAPAAVAMGLLNEAAPAAQLDAAVNRYVDSLLKGGPNALAACKRLVRDVPGQPVAGMLQVMASRSAALFASEEAREGMLAFAEKRPPRWQESNG